ncbi:ribonuclease J [Alphaproteobacteria bacterium]|nr:ribonuclease J [Alphaproteobacteria bacterium]MDA8625842.1 ribonuclease J [Alphaproteobacteria bacterium]MDA8643104.1 ribonuclease J [Alphaproteobacteria bacterium]MDA8667107.1 ribonuclease J [Alphaproteobacteria bacterium]MDA9590874.1 ribonuclease J [Alphaproteobacteria bacterium]
MTDKNDKELVFLPLGGTGEIGMNCNLYGFGARGKRQWIMVDLGVTFGKHSDPGIDVITPDISFIEKQKKNLCGLLLTHGHEDHIGAVAHLWPRLKCPVYATPFTAALVRGKLAEAGLLDEVPLHIIEPDAHLEIGPFAIDYICLTHSIAEPSALAIEVEGARILHTGDWKIDPDPVIGKLTEVDRLKALGDAGIDAIICDSTNVLSPGRSGSEADVGRMLEDVVCESTGRVVITTFASNVARLTSIAAAAVKSGRHLCLAGRGMHKIYQAARETGYLTQFPEIVDESDAGYLPPEKVLICCTGSQGESNAALGRMANGRHPHLTLEPGDRVIFSSKMIPGNETEILALQNQLAQIDVEIISPNGSDIHVSGHPCRDELADMYEWARPRSAIPVHGEHRHLIAHAALAKELGVAEPCRVHNGDVVRLAPAPTEVIDAVQTGRLHLDGYIMTEGGSAALKERRKISYNGVVFVAVPIDAANRLAGQVEVELAGAPTDDGMVKLTDWTLDAVERAIPSSGRLRPERAEQDISVAVRRELSRRWGKRPLVIVSFVSV